MAQLQRDDIVSLWTQGVQAVKDKSSCAAVITAKELSIVWGSDSRYWKWVSKTYPISCEALEVAKLITVCWLQIDGEYDTSNLKKGVKYGVYFVVELSDNLCMNGPVTLKLTRPNRTTEEHKEDLETKPKNTLVGLKVGEFINSACGCENTVKFSMNGCDGTTWKTGLTVIGAVIAPVW
ncbi:protein PHLOEM PROTEIN 2-LIKE A1-like isoform X3 [Daucus carota subsp. sativus]|uniref:protein PHLOEM PROTEIN 2-LIKE A1-like isoform X3 n=1 Tax=Daucus carota subsp. sativus TaxID=79200 RepID=UPI0007EF854F|nr:PREDICTED: protein PHLOEM PROTEIN 2-LIKE A1-like [Daucus carota subsp. sativus]